MYRLRRIEQSHRFFFITTNLASAPLLPHERTLILQDLAATRRSHDFLLFSFVIMPDHLHLLCYPREATLTDVLRDFKSASALNLRKSRHACGSIWQPRFFDAICRKVHNFWEKMDYIHQNPVRSGLVDHPHDWPWSSAANTFSSILTPDPIDLPAVGETPLWPAPWKRL